MNLFEFIQLSFYNSKKFLLFLVVSSFFYLAMPSVIHAAGNCSPYLGRATLNEFFKDRSNMANDPDDFAEIKILDGTIASAIFDTWTIEICEDNEPGNNNDNDGCSGSVSVSNFTEKSLPWIVLKDGNIGSYINFKTGFDAILLDGNGDVIDYLTVDGHNDLEEAGCTGAALPFDYQTSSPGASDKFIFRSPDGTGDWDSAPSASAPPTEDDTNDEDPNGGVPPIVSVNNVTVNKGQTATFTFTLEKTVNYEVRVDYTTTGGTAVADTAPPVNYDYIYKTGTVTFPANTTTLTATVDISTNSVNPSTAGTVFFYLYIVNNLNAKINNNYPIGTILGNATAEWYMDEASWNGTAGEVIDISSNTNHGTAKNGLTTVTPGYLCNAGSFDGSDDYIEIPHDASIQGSTQLTYAAWIKPDTWTGLDQIMSKSVHGGGAGRAQMGIFSENGELVGRAETSAGRLNVYTSLPATGSWTHIILVFDGTSLTLYKNGSVADNISSSKTSSITFSTTTLNQNNDPLMISKRVGTDVYYFDGLIDEVLVMQSALPAGFISTMYSNYTSGLNWNGAARSCPGSLHHIEFIHDTAAITCNAEQITVKACANSDCSSLSSSAVTVGLLPTGWVGGDTQTFTGSADYNLKHTVAETVTLDTSSVTPVASNPVECKDSGGSTISCDITFSDSGFIFYNETDSSTTIPTQLSGKSSDTGYNAKTIKLQAVKKSDNDATQCSPAFQNKTLDIDFAAECKNPSSCVASQLFNLTSGAVNGDLTATTNDNSAPGSSSYDTRSITFDVNGEANIIFNYPESGLIELHARHNILLADGTTPSGNYMSGESSFVIRPFALALSGLSYATDATGNVFKEAGEDFTTTFTAVRWQAADDTNNDGIADTGADLTDNVTTTNFGNENIPVIPANIMTSLPAVPLATVIDAGTLTNSANSSNFTNGVGTKSYNWSEVGIFDLTTTLTNYLGAGDDIIGRAQNVGRFTPHHFETLVSHGCTSFTYSGQPFTVTAFARNKANATTVNYRGPFAKGVTLSDANPGAPPLGAFTNNTFDSASFSVSPNYGQSTATNLIYTFTTKETLPETIEIRATDITDTAISSDTFAEGSTEIRSGRTLLNNAFGSELVDMAVTAQVEYFDGNDFAINTSDTCSDISVTLTDIGTDTVTVGDGSIAGNTCIWDDTAASGTDNCSDASLLPGPASNQFQEAPPLAGSFNLFLKAPGENFTGDIGITLTSPTWLQFDWDGDGNHDNDPSGVSSFGLYRGDDRVIYWREVFE